jgi:hypothetical protein
MNHKTESKTEEAVMETFPASDPVASPGAVGARAVPVGEVLASDAPPIPDAVTVRHAFPDAERAKIAKETLVREAPIDPRYAEIGSDHELRVTVSAKDKARIEALLARC